MELLKIKHLTQIQLNILQLLEDGCCHSGSELGQALGITRTAIWKQINQLIEAGVPILRKARQGYQLHNALIMLNSEHIKDQLTQKEFSAHYALHVFHSIDSTNRFLKELPASQTVDICCAEFQSQGRGRFGRHWYSPFGENIYCSSRWVLNTDLAKLSGLSLVASLAVFETIGEFINTAEIQMKWPNDILWRDKKLSGSLIEILTQPNERCEVIIGIGLNVNTDTINTSLPDKPWCSLFEISGQQFNRNVIIATVLKNLEDFLDRFLKEGFGDFLAKWNELDYLIGKQIRVNQALNSFTGMARGINSLGQLILENDQGYREFLSSGDASLGFVPNLKS